MTKLAKEKLLKHVKIVLYLLVSGLLAWIIARFSGQENFIYVAPVINYVLYVVEKEIKEEGFVKTMLR